MLVLHGGDKVGCPEAEVIVAGAGVEDEQAGGSLTGFGRLTGRFYVDGTEGVGADLDQELSVGGLGDIEAVEQGESLIGFGTCDVGLTGLVQHNSGNEVEGVAVIVRAGIHHIDDVEAAQSFSRGDLGGIDGGRRFANVDGLPDFLLAGEGDFDGRSANKLHIGLIDRVEAFLFYVKLVGAGGKGGKFAASVEVGEAAEKRLGRGLDGNADVADRNSGVVDDNNGGSERGLGRRGADQHESDQVRTHANQPILRSDAGGLALVFCGDGGERFAYSARENTLTTEAPRNSAEIAEEHWGDCSLPRMDTVFSKRGTCSKIMVRVCRMPALTSYEALQLTASFAITAERMKTADINFYGRAAMFEAASRITFLKAHVIAKEEETTPLLGEIARRAVFAVV